MSFLKQYKISFHDLKDAELVQGILEEQNKEKKRKLQEVLYDRYANKIYYKCQSILKDTNTAKDLAHEVILKVFLNLHQYKGEGTLLSWILTITYHQCISYLNKQKKMQLEEDVQVFEQEDTQEIILEEKKLMELRLDQLQQLLATMKESERAILMMYYQDELSIKKISQLLKIGESAVKMRLKRSRDRLAKLMKNAI